MAERSARICGEDAAAAIEQKDAALGGIDVAKIVAHVKLRDVADGAGKLHAGGPAADDDEVQRRMPAVLDHLPLGQLEGQQHAAANLDGVFNGFQAGRKRRPLVVAEVGVRGSGGQDKVVVVELRTAGQRQLRVRRRRCRRPRPSALRYCAWWRRMVRMGWAMSAGDSTASATW